MMKNITINNPDTEKMDSDLEEGEIHDFAVSTPDSDKDACGVKSEKSEFLKSEYLQHKLECDKETAKKNIALNNQVYINPPGRNNSNNSQRRDERHGSPPSEGECVSEDDKFCGNQVVQKYFYESNTVDRGHKSVHPFQMTCGSVEDIMTKIGETLCRSSNSYYKERRSKANRKSLCGRSRRDAILRESSPTLKRLRTNYYKKGRRSESVSDSDCDSWGKNIKMKHKGFKHRKKKTQEKRKREPSEVISDNWNYSDVSGQYKYRDKTEKNYNVYGMKLLKVKKTGVDSRFFKEISLPQEQNCKIIEMQESNANDSMIPASVKERDTIRNDNNACGRDDYLGSRSSRGSSEQYSPSTEDKDDDIELIKLRLLALTSNKRKNRASAENRYNNLNDLKANDGKNCNDPPKCEEPDKDITEENLSPRNDSKIKECHFDTDSDRYELYLRAEALKTALLKKHQHRIKRQKNTGQSNSSVPGNGSGKDAESSKTNEMLASEKITSNPSYHAAKDDENNVLAPANVIQVTNKIATNCPSHSNVNVKGSLCDLSNNVDCNLVSVPVGASKSTDSPNECFPVYENSLKNDDPVPSLSQVTESNVHDNENLKKKMKRTRMKKIKMLRALDLNESNIKENNKVHDKCEEDSAKLKAQLLCDIDEKDSVKEPEKKFVLTDSLEKRNLQPSRSAVGEKKLTLEPKQSFEGEGVDGVTSSVNATQIPGAAPKAEVERIIVHLGSDSSDDDSAPYVSKDPKCEEMLTDNSAMSNDFGNKVDHYEESVELLLKEARRRIEKKLETPTRVPATPEAVYNHLAPSQRLEYMRLKQKIAEREKLRKMKKNECNHGESSVFQGSNSNIGSECKAKVNRGISETKTYSSSRLFGDKGVRLNDEVPRYQAGPNFNTSFIIRNETKNTYQKLLVKKDISNLSAVGGKNIGRPRKIEAVVSNQVVSYVNSKKDGNIRCNNLKTDLADSSLKNSLKKEASSNSVSIEKSILEKKKILTQNRLHLERLKVLWKNIKIEKMVEEKYINEIKRLKLQQKFFELKVNQQRLKIRKLAVESKQIYEAFQRKNKGVEINNRKKKNPAKDKFTQKVVETKEVERDGSTKDSQPKKDGGEDDTVSSLARATQGSLVITCGNTESEIGKQCDRPSGKDAELQGPTLIDDLKEYSSPLQILSATSESDDRRRVDPNTIMCQYDLLGKCNDEECAFQHWRA